VALEPDKRVVLQGSIRIRNHCTFVWRERASGGRRTAHVKATHCADCAAELRELGYLLAYVEPRGAQG
jgi:hypothetical protein